jgi:hypothetical protein
MLINVGEGRGALTVNPLDAGSVPYLPSGLLTITSYCPRVAVGGITKVLVRLVTDPNDTVVALMSELPDFLSVTLALFINPVPPIRTLLSVVPVTPVLGEIL